MKLGINGLGRIGKLTAWHHVGRKFFDEIVINIGRETGTSFEDLLHYLERDSTYGIIQNYLYGHKAKPIIKDINYSKRKAVIDGIPVKFLTKTRNPSEINWGKHSVEIVVDTTGQFLDPTLPDDIPNGSIMGHFKSGIKKVIISAPFKMVKESNKNFPEYAVTTVMGINGNDYNPQIHKIISNASCTTTCLAHMLKPLIDTLGSKRILLASMATVHAATGSQEVLDRLPKAGKIDLRKNRSMINNIILTTTGAAKTLNLVLPEIKNVGFIAESVRVPIVAGSLIILVLSIQEGPYTKPINRKTINKIYYKRAKSDPYQYLRYTEDQNVSRDILEISKAAAIIEGYETHTRTAEINLDFFNIPGVDQTILKSLKKTNINVPVTQAVIYGWYDNEMGGYVNLLGDRTVSIAKTM